MILLQRNALLQPPRIPPRGAPRGSQEGRKTGPGWAQGGSGKPPLGLGQIDPRSPKRARGRPRGAPRRAPRDPKQEGLKRAPRGLQEGPQRVPKHTRRPGPPPQTFDYAPDFGHVFLFLGLSCTLSFGFTVCPDVLPRNVGNMPELQASSNALQVTLL